MKHFRFLWCTGSPVGNVNYQPDFLRFTDVKFLTSFSFKIIKTVLALISGQTACEIFIPEINVNEDILQIPSVRNFINSPDGKTQRINK